MLIWILSLPLGALDSKSRFALAAFIVRYGLAETEALTIEKLSGELGLPVKECSDAIRNLSGASVVTCKPPPFSRAGRSKKIYGLGDSVAYQLGLANAATSGGRGRGTFHREVVTHLIKGPYIYALGPDVKVTNSVANESEAAGRNGNMPKRRSLLSRSNRLVLAILFGHADNFGVVESLGNVELCKLAGLDLTSIKQRVRKLIELGFIRRHVPGVASPILAGKLKSSYVLNLNHRQIAPAADTVGFAVHEIMGSEASDPIHLGRVWFELERVRNSLPTEFLTPRPVLCFFRGAPRHVIDRIDFFLTACATDLLTQHWDQIGAAKLDFFARLKDSISAFFRKPMKDLQDGSSLSEDEIVEFLWFMTLEFVKECKLRFSQLDGFSLPTHNCRILPVDLGRGYGALALLVEGVGGGGWLTTVRGDKFQTKKIAREAACPVGLRERAGLLTTKWSS